MSSKDVAERTDKKHTNVIRDIRDMMEALNKADDSKLSHEYNQGLTEIKDERGYTKEFLMSRPVVELLVTGYGVPHRAKALSRLHVVRRLSPVARTCLCARR
ncbi:Rha family transcriptional regulator [Paraburkholderia denitrificans]|uniref:Rha family transcriptional regulator n=1 Tax=Paraburkholderia denitrificans TaxID=694025 RepID=A0ABW0J3J9_9BURK